MGKCKDLSPQKITQITTLLKHTSHSQRQIAKLTEVSQASVRRINAKLATAQPTKPQRKGRCGKKKLVTPRGQRCLRNIVLENRKASYSDIKKHFEKSGYNVSERTVRRNLFDMGFRSRRPVKKPKLTDTMVKKRYAWASSYKHFTLDNWKMVSKLNVFNICILLISSCLHRFATAMSQRSRFCVTNPSLSNEGSMKNITWTV